MIKKIRTKSFIFLAVVFSFSFFAFNFVEAAECKLINILTDKSEVGPGESIQVNVTAQKECIGRTARIHICDDLSCREITAQTFSSNSLIFNIIPADFFERNTAVWVQATVPFNTVKSSMITFSGSQVGNKAEFGEFCTKTEECAGELTCAGNACVECNVNEVLNNCPSNTTCQDGACVPVTGETEETSQEETGSKKENVLGGFPGEDLEANDVINIVIGLSCWLMRVASVLAVIFVIIVGLKFMVAQGNQTKYGEAVTSFKHVLWGVLVIFGVYVIIATVANAVGVTNFSFIPLVC